jgi:uncharacterized alpha-E superfamily protein
MTHNEGWHFGRLGRLLERADKTSRIVDVKYFLLLPDASYVGSPYDEIHWSALLKSASAFEMYRKRYGRIAPASVVEFLLLDRKFPRSVRYCVGKAERSLHAITGRSDDDPPSTSAEALSAALRGDLSRARVADVIAAGVHQYLDDFQTRLNAVGSAVYESFFAPPRQAAGASAP